MPNVKATLKKKINGYLYDVNLKTSADNVIVNDNTSLTETLDDIYNGLTVNVDDSLSVKGDAADAAVTGELLKTHSEDIDSLKNIFTNTKNIFNKNKVKQNSVISTDGKVTFSQIANNITSGFIPLFENESKIKELNILIPNYDNEKILNIVHCYSDDVSGMEEKTYLGQVEAKKNSKVIHINGSIYTLYEISVPDNAEYAILELTLVSGLANSILNNILVCDSTEFTGRLYSYGTKCIKNDYIDLENLKELVYKENGISIHDANDNTIIKMNEKNGIRILNNNYSNPATNNFKMMIGINKSDELSDIQAGIQLEKDGNEGSFYVKDGQKELIHLSSTYGYDDVIWGNSKLSIYAGNTASSLSFNESTAGIRYLNATWEEHFKQLEISTKKGVVIEANDNSYFKSGDKKLVIGNNFNQIEFRTDGIAKFKNVINAKDYQINGTPIIDKIKTISKETSENYKQTKSLNNNEIGHIKSEEFDWSLISQYNDLNMFYNLNLHLLPNRTYRFDNSDSKSITNYISTLKLNFGSKYSQCDTFTIDVELASIYYDNGVDSPLYITPKIILPFSVTWKNGQSPKLKSSSSTNTFVSNHIEITISNNIASYKTLSENNKLFNVLYPDYTFKFTDLSHDDINGTVLKIDGNNIIFEEDISVDHKAYTSTVFDGSFDKISLDMQEKNSNILRFTNCNERTYIEVKNVKWDEGYQSILIDDEYMNISEDYKLNGAGKYDIYVCGTTVYCVPLD